MKKLTGIIITKNEENMIADCIDSLSFCDEIVVIDSNSDDNTVAIAKHMGATVYPVDDTIFSQAKRRNFGKEKAKGKWIFYVDADERVSKELQHSIMSLLDSDTGKDAYRVLRQNYYFGNHPWPTIEKLERLFKKTALKEWTGDLHETANIDGEIGELDGYLMHYTHRDLTSMLAKTIAWSKIEAELRYNSHHPPMTWWRFPRVMGTAFYDSYIRQKGYRVGFVGLLESLFQAYSMFITYARLWEMQMADKKKVV